MLAIGMTDTTSPPREIRTEVLVLVERYPALGRVCLNVGCIPSKEILHVARVIAEISEFKIHGIDLGEPKPDPGALRKWTEQVVGITDLYVPKQ